MTLPKILVTSAAGRTGIATTVELLKRGYPVRAFVRRQDARSKQLASLGAEVFVGNLFDYRDLEKALTGVQRAYHCPPFGSHLLHNTMLFAIAAEQSGLETLVLMSQWQPHETHPSSISREHWIANQIVRWMPSVNVIHLNPGLFAFTYLLGLPAAYHFGMLMLPFGESENAPASNEDIGAVAAALLANPDDHIGNSYRPTGPKLITGHDVADALTSTLGRKIKYSSTSSKNFIKAALAQNFPVEEIAHVLHYFADLNAGAYALGAPTNHVEMLTGRPAETIQETVHRYARTPSLIHPKLELGSKLQAFAFLARMLAARVPDFDEWRKERGDPTLINPLPSMSNPRWRRNAENQQLNLLDFDQQSSNQPHLKAIK